MQIWLEMWINTSLPPPLKKVLNTHPAIAYMHWNKYANIKYVYI